MVRTCITVAHARIAEGAFGILDERADLAGLGIEDGEASAISTVEPVVLVAAVVAEIGVVMGGIVTTRMAFGKEDFAGHTGGEGTMQDGQDEDGGNGSHGDYLSVVTAAGPPSGERLPAMSQALTV